MCILVPITMRMEWQSWAGDPNEGGRGWLCFHICPELRISAKFSLCKQSRRKNNPGCFPERTPPEVEYNPTSMKNTKQFTNGSVPVWVSTQEATSRGFPHVLASNSLDGAKPRASSLPPDYWPNFTENRGQHYRNSPTMIPDAFSGNSAS